MKRPVVELVGTGRCVPRNILTNADLEKMVDTSDEWILERTGIRERHIATADETLACMGKHACEQVLEATGVDVADIDSIIVATASPDHLLPSQACDLQATLGAKNAAAFDVGAACAGFLYALAVAEGMVVTGQAKHVLVVGAERLSAITDYQDRSTCILFGDGVGATLVRAASNGSSGILSSYLKTDGTLRELLYRPGGGAIQPPSEEMIEQRTYFLRMEGRQTFKHAVRKMADACEAFAKKKGWRPVNIAIVDSGANLKLFRRQDDAFIGSIDIAQLKANSSARIISSSLVESPVSAEVGSKIVGRSRPTTFGTTMCSDSAK
ncbi:MAG: beta-ketoacyl-ACP synthase 3 [Gemmatimonadetes bacterium]|nr:beta-ketoacyl-ACP synthase 3 [Gemmatimonadota bacterium]